MDGDIVHRKMVMSQWYTRSQHITAGGDAHREMLLDSAGGDAHRKSISEPEVQL